MCLVKFKDARLAARISKLVRQTSWEEGLSLALGRLKYHEAAGMPAPVPNDPRLSPRLLVMSSGISALSQASAWTKALSLLSASRKYQVLPDVVLYNATAAACDRASHWQWSLQLFDRMHGGRLHTDSTSLNVLISACGRASRWELALAFTVGACKLQGQPQLDALGEAKGVGAAIDALGRAGQWRIALSLLDEVRTRSVASIGCFNAAIAAAARSGQWLQASQCLEAVHRLRLTPTAITKGAEIHVLGLGDKGKGPRGLGWQGCLAALLQPNPFLNLHVLNASLSSCGRARRWELVHSLLQLMPILVIVPDALSASAVVSSCASSFKWEHALELRPRESDWKSLGLELSASRSIFVCLPHVACRWMRCLLRQMVSLLQSAPRTEQEFGACLLAWDTLKSYNPELSAGNAWRHKEYFDRLHDRRIASPAFTCLGTQCGRPKAADSSAALSGLAVLERVHDLGPELSKTALEVSGARSMYVLVLPARKRILCVLPTWHLHLRRTRVLLNAFLELPTCESSHCPSVAS
ncbi:PPR10 [Symbiodinium sp. CCMP2592]|nr:PPR10 [Symbiodinium sp. CCMP2592]